MRKMVRHVWIVAFYVGVLGSFGASSQAFAQETTPTEPAESAKPDDPAKEDPKPDGDNDAEPGEAQPDNEAQERQRQRQRDLANKVRQLVRQLDADKLADRDAAEQELTKMGATILDLLPPADRNMPGDVRQRLARISNAIESTAANLSGDPTKVSLSGQIRLDDALKDLENQSGNRVLNGNGEVVTVDFKNELYLKALDSLLDQTQMNLEMYGGEPGALSLVERPAGEASRSERAAYAGAFRLEPIRVQSVRNLRNPDVQGCRVAMRVEWEPRLNPVSITQDLGDLTIVDDQGKSLEVEGQGMRGAEVQPGASGIELELPISLPDRKAGKIASLKGKLVALLPGRVETFQFDRRLDESAGMELRKAGCTVVLDRVRKNGELYQVLIRVRFDNARDSLESHRGWIFQNEAFIVDAKGQRIGHAGLEATRQAPNEVGVSYYYALKDGLEGCQFVYRTPSVILELPVEYEIKDIPLP